MTPDLPGKPATPEEDQPPLGMRIAIVFLRVIGVAIYLPLLLSAVAAAMALIRGCIKADLMSPHALLVVAPFGVFLVMLITTLGCDWLVHYLRTATMGSPWSTRFQRPLHPARHIVLPLVGSMMGYAFIAVLAWLPSLTRSPFSETWPWPAVWGAIGFGAVYLYYILDEKLP